VTNELTISADKDIQSSDPVDEMYVFRSLETKICTHRKPLSVLLSNRHKYGMEEYPSYSEFVMMLREKDQKFIDMINKLEYDILQGANYANAVDGVDEENFVKIKGSQVLHSMLAKDKGIDKKTEVKTVENTQNNFYGTDQGVLKEFKECLTNHLAKNS